MVLDLRSKTCLFALQKEVDIGSLKEEINNQGRHDTCMLKCLTVEWKIKWKSAGLNVPDSWTLPVGKCLTMRNSFTNDRMLSLCFE